MLLITAMVLSIVPSKSFAQVPDTVVVAAWPPGNLNNFIQSDTLADGTHPNRVYVLQQTGPIDTIYFISSTLRMNSLTLVGKKNPTTGFPPIVAPNINEDNSSPSPLIRALGHGTISLNNLYIMGTRLDGSSTTGSCIYTGGDSSLIKADHCVFENFSAGGTPNIWDTWGAIHIRMNVTNCEFRNNQCDVPQNPGMNWAGPGPFAVDTAIYKNNTFFIIGGTIVGSDQTPDYLEFDHNTVFMMTKAALFTLQQMNNARITNNICYGVFQAGLDSLTSYDIAYQNANFYSPPAVVELDTLGAMKGTPWFFTEAGRRITVENNAYFWPSYFHDHWAEVNAVSTQGTIVEPTFVQARLPEMLTDRTAWPGINITNNFNTDPGFDAALVTVATDNMFNFIKTIWSTGSGAGIRPYVYQADPNQMYAGVLSNWATTKGYPVLENLRYSNVALQSAGSDGKAIGDLNWFPEQLTAISERPASVARGFGLNQNYPNPFNPSTKISYTLSAKGLTRLSVYDVLGREVAVLINKVQNAGPYEVTFEAKDLSSGIYYYKLTNSETTVTMKMLLLK
jgi:hypothetical protein